IYMSLEEYNKKRKFAETPEPEGLPEREDEKPVFVVQRHQASTLHFDFRLEEDGVLKSWAVPKGLSMNASDKRLAVEVEDHPLEYASFHGIIPEGNYGAGVVEIWDEGTWEPNENSKNVNKALEKGTLDFTLQGKKLKGRFVLIKTKGSYSKNDWLLIKKKDEYATTDTYDANEIE
ncbi:MAG: 3'-phosphoesterase, partial [Bacteroides sp.]|nr:3'-phosphoesterase [Bacteroides sp.]